MRRNVPEKAMRYSWLFVVVAAIISSGLALDIQCAGQGISRSSPTSPVPSNFHWPNGKRAAVSLSFDDVRTSQVDVGLALFKKLGVKVTFFVQPQGVEKRLQGWKAAVQDGHEIGNHTLTHPCTGNYAFSRNNALENY